MKCPYCGEETGTGRACEKCGKEPVSPKGVEVEYKDFKISELLDIKMTRRGSSGKAMKKYGPAMEKEGEPKRASPAGQKTSGKKGPLVVTAGIVILAAIAAFYLLRFLIGF